MQLEHAREQMLAKETPPWPLVSSLSVCVCVLASLQAGASLMTGERAAAAPTLHWAASAPSRMVGPVPQRVPEKQAPAAGPQASGQLQTDLEPLTGSFYRPIKETSSEEKRN